jgi:hypothetical protein
MWAWFQCRTSPKDICDVTIWPIGLWALHLANFRPAEVGVSYDYAVPVCWPPLARSAASSIRVINIFGLEQRCHK